MEMTKDCNADDVGGRLDEGGLGIIEIVISLFLLALLAMSFVPILLNAWKVTAKNTTIATATQLVNQNLEGARSVRSATAGSPSCYDLTQYLKITPSPVTDPRGVILNTQWDATTCPSSYPGVVRVGISVSQSGATTPLASAVTLIFVSTATGP